MPLASDRRLMERRERKLIQPDDGQAFRHVTCSPVTLVFLAAVEEKLDQLAICLTATLFS